MDYSDVSNYFKDIKYIIYNVLFFAIQLLLYFVRNKIKDKYKNLAKALFVSSFLIFILFLAISFVGFKFKSVIAKKKNINKKEA